MDTQYAPLSNKILAAIRSLSQGPLRYIINTHSHGDHVGGNENLKKAGATIAGGNVTRRHRRRRAGRADHRAHQRLQAHERESERRSTPRRPAAWPTSTFIGDDKKLYFNGEGIHIVHQPAAHTDGDSIVFFRKSDVISAGDLFVTNGYPVHRPRMRAATCRGSWPASTRSSTSCIPVYGQEGGTMVIPGHGRLSDMGDVINYREMVTIVRDRVQDMVKKNMTLDQVKAAKPTRDYDPLYSTPGAFVTGDAFVEAVYRSLKK